MPDRLRLLLLSFLLLFVELALIRWTGENVVYLSYFSNFVLLGSFLGIGIGFLRAHARVRLFVFAPVALAAFVVFIRVYHVQIDRSETQLLYFGKFTKSGAPMWVMLPVIFLCTAIVMAMIAEEAARTFARFRALDAYRLDILGSILGIAAFTLIAFLGLPPVAWGAVVAALFLLLVPRRVLVMVAVAAAVLLVALATEQKPGISWSPYYKISVVPGKGFYAVSVNGIPHQTISTVRQRLRREPLYGTPYKRHVGTLNNVLIVGAGTGTDVAIALAHGAHHVDAVEIDPRLYELGQQLQPNHAYQSPRVSVFINDGRAYLEQTKRKYDLILFALPDSLTLVSGQSSLRLESFLFTLQAIQSARAHLEPDGTFAMYNYYRTQWLVDRLAGTLTQVFGKRPCLDLGKRINHFAALADGNVRCARTWNPGGRTVPAPATDNYPFLYLRTPSIPGFYLLTLALILSVAVVGVRTVGAPFKQMRPYLDLFFMGAAFLLLETKNVVQFALLFGTTWLVNALVFGGILLVVLAAIEVSRRVRIPAAVLYPAVFVTLAVAWLVPPDNLLSLSFVPRLASALALAFAPIFCANLLFAQRFKETASLTIAFGANLLGAMIGGVLEYTSLIFGYRALLILIAGLYAAAFLAGRVSPTRQAASDG
jgi:Spermine/spermidine synthase domain